MAAVLAMEWQGSPSVAMAETDRRTANDSQSYAVLEWTLKDVHTSRFEIVDEALSIKGSLPYPYRPLQ